MRLIDNRNCYCAVDILESSDEKIVSATSRIDADGSGPCEAEIACESPEAAGYFEAVVC
jgi:hypothetical protein